ncbi:conserved hypothetical protein [Ricinus communis]|uniref:Uncharacterized protein n=1 Tax=Ricinus communis TaxID=3988 RepID=B9SU99_RICCO|nr:conserved hypothetical protein [Ricinus communis]
MDSDGLVVVKALVAELPTHGWVWWSNSHKSIWKLWGGGVATGVVDIAADGNAVNGGVDVTVPPHDRPSPLSPVEPLAIYTITFRCQFFL